MIKKLHECSWSFLRATKLVDKKPARRFASKVANASNERLVEACTMPEARGPPLLGMASWLISSAAGTKLHEYVDQKHKELGPIYKDCVGPVKAIFVNSPDEYRKIFRLEGPMPKHYLPEAFYAYNQMRNCKRGLLFMYVQNLQKKKTSIFKLKHSLQEYPKSYGFPIILTDSYRECFNSNRFVYLFLIVWFFINS